jgi:predicted NBD/HSP70 family sugar kinase
MKLGIDIGGTFIKYALVDDDLNIVKNWKKETKRFFDKDVFYDYLCADIDAQEIEYVGVSAPGVVHPSGTMLSKASKLTRDIYQTNVPEEVSKRLDRPCAVVNDAKSAGFCEMMIGNGKGTKSSVYFVIGTGIGGCVCDERGVIEGVDGIAGEFSNLPAGLDENGKIIKLVSLASMSALIDIYNQKVEEERHVKYGTEVSERYLNQEEEAVAAMDEWCKNILMGFELINIFYNPEIICVGGGISKADWFIEKLQAMAKENSMDEAFTDLKTYRIDRCRYDNDANILGAILKADQQFKQA